MDSTVESTPEVGDGGGTTEEGIEGEEDIVYSRNIRKEL
jgi:hypothetical protein